MPGRFAGIRDGLKDEVFCFTFVIGNRGASWCKETTPGWLIMLSFFTLFSIPVEQQCGEYSKFGVYDRNLLSDRKFPCPRRSKVPKKPWTPPPRRPILMNVNTVYIAR